MRICFTGFEAPILVCPDATSVLEVHNRVLFSRICGSLSAELGDVAQEPYLLWDDQGSRLKPAGQSIVVGNPFDLPWDDRTLVSGLSSCMEELLVSDESARSAAEEGFAELRSTLLRLALSMESDYSFDVDWDLKKYLRAFGFGVDISADETLIEKLIKFLQFTKDASCKKVLIFLNLKLFLSADELQRFYEQCFFANACVLLLENTPDQRRYERERKYVVDQDFLEAY